MRSLVTRACLCALLLTPASAFAQADSPPEEAAQPALQLHVFGPPGSGDERRALVVVSRGGTCVPADTEGLVLSGRGAEVTPLEVVGRCTRWVQLARSGTGQTHLVATLGDQSAERVVELSPAPLRLRARRRGAALTVQVQLETDEEGAGRDAVIVRAYWTGGQVALERGEDGVYRGAVPETGMVGVVAHHDVRTGTALITGGRGGGIVLAPSALSVPASEPARTAFFVFATNAAGRPTRNVALNVQSEGAELRALNWRQTGIAAVDLVALPGERRVRVRLLGTDATTEQEGQALELPVFGGWPAAVDISGPAELDPGETGRFEVGLRLADGTMGDARTLQLRCGETPAELSDEGVVTCEGEAPYVVHAVFAVDAEQVPLGRFEVARRAQEADADPDADSDATADGSARGLAIRGGAYVGVDSWKRAHLGLGAQLAVELAGPLWLQAGLRYTIGIDSATGRGTVMGQLDLLQHTFDLLVGAELNLLEGSALGLRIAARTGVSIVRNAATFAGIDADGSEARVPIEVAAGPTFSLGDSLELGIDAVIRATVRPSQRTWAEAPVRFGIEVTLGVR